MDAASIYKRRAVESATPIGLIILLYEGILQGLRLGIEAIEAGNAARAESGASAAAQAARQIETRTAALNRVLAMLGELRGVLDHKRGGSAAALFARFYQLAESNIFEASVRQDAEPLRELLGPFAEVQAAWRQAEALPPGVESVSALGAEASWAEGEPLARAGGVSWQA